MTKRRGCALHSFIFVVLFTYIYIFMIAFTTTPRNAKVDHGRGVQRHSTNGRERQREWHGHSIRTRLCAVSMSIDPPSFLCQFEHFIRDDSSFLKDYEEGGLRDREGGKGISYRPS